MAALSTVAAALPVVNASVLIAKRQVKRTIRGRHRADRGQPHPIFSYTTMPAAMSVQGPALPRWLVGTFFFPIRLGIVFSQTRPRRPKLSPLPSYNRNYVPIPDGCCRSY